MSLINPFTQDPVTHPGVVWSTLFEATAFPARLRPNLNEVGGICVVGLNGSVTTYSQNTGAVAPLASTGGQPSDIVFLPPARAPPASPSESAAPASLPLISDVAWNNLLTLSDGQVTGLLDENSGVTSPVALCTQGDLVYFADQTGLFAFSTEGRVQRLLDQGGIVAVCCSGRASPGTIFFAVNGENCIKAFRPGFQPVVYASNFCGAFRISDLCEGPEGSLLVAAEAVSGKGYMYVVSNSGVASACVELPGAPTSICCLGDRIAVSVEGRYEVYTASADQLV